jgi:hypothetical protein
MVSQSSLGLLSYNVKYRALESVASLTHLFLTSSLPLSASFSSSDDEVEVDDDI